MSDRDELAAALWRARYPKAGWQWNTFTTGERRSSGALEQADSLLASDWLAARDADLRERIATVVREMQLHPDDREGTEFDRGFSEALTRVLHLLAEGDQANCQCNSCRHYEDVNDHLDVLARIARTTGPTS